MAEKFRQQRIFELELHYARQVISWRGVDGTPR